MRSFDRPSDAALTCTIYDPNIVPDPSNPSDRGRYEPRPLSACAPLPSTQVETSVDRSDPTGNTKFFPVLRALVANSARGEVALVDIPNAGIVDLDGKNPGFNFVPVGRLPEAIRTSGDGCMAVTANVDSCDLSVLDLTTLYNMPFVPNRSGQSRAFADHVVRRIELSAGGNRLEARPTAIELGPLVEHPGNDLSCYGGVYRAWVALPGCEAVVEAELELDGDTDPIRAEITRAIHVGRDGATVLADPSQLVCPDECSAGSTPVSSTDPTSPAGVVPSSQAAPGALALDTENDTQRLVIGDLYGERLAIVPLDPTTGEPGAPRSLVLDGGALGVLRARISPRTPAGKFLYAIARDGTVHVVDLDQELECETNPDPSELGAVPPIDPALDARRLGCFPIGDPATPRRAATAIGPGIALPNGTPARDVAFVHLDTPIPPTSGPPFSAQPALLVGDFAWIVGSDGRANVVTIYDACPQPNDPQPQPDGSFTPACDIGKNAEQSRTNAFTSNFGNPYPLELERVSHRLRNGARRFLQPNSVGDAAGTPRVQDPANPVTVTVEGSPAKAGNGFRLPTLDSVTRTIAGINNAPAVPVTIEAPDPEKARAETWTLGWEGAIPGTQRSFGRVCGVGDDDCPRGALVDSGAAFCARGVLPGDKVELLGCDVDADCTYTQVCAHDPGAPVDVKSGLCLDVDRDDEISRCSVLLRAQRRYRIVDARQGAILPSGASTDVLDLAEIYEPEFLHETHGCTVDADCGDVTVTAPATGNVSRPPLPTSCLVDSDGQSRCLRACDPEASGEAGLCGTGYLCAAASSSTPDSPDFRCMRAPRDIGLFTDCLKNAQRYRVRTGAAWSVVGSISGFASELQPNPVTRSCESPPMSSEHVRLQNPRIPVDAPLCPQQVDPALGIDALSWIAPPGPNVCRLQTSDADLLFHYQNAFIAFALRMPKNPTGYIPEDDTSVSFILVGGGFPLALTLGITGELSAQAPRSMAVAPDRQTVFVVDEGKGTASTALRGQLLRLVSAVQAVDPGFRVR